MPNKQELRYVYRKGGWRDGYILPTITIYVYTFMEGYKPSAQSVGEDLLEIQGQCDKEQSVKYPYGLKITNLPINYSCDLELSMKIMNRILKDVKVHGHGYRTILMSLRKMKIQRFELQKYQDVDGKVKEAWVPWKHRNVAKAYVELFENGKSITRSKKK